MITVNSFFTDSLNTVDAVIGNFVNTAYTNFVRANSGLITSLFTVYVMFLGYRFLFHSHHFNLSTVTQHLVTMLCVYGLIMNWQLYHLFVYKIFTTEPGNIAQILVNSAGKFQSESSIAQALDGIYEAIMNASMGFFGQMNFSASGIAFLFYGGLVFLIGSLMCVFALLLFIYAKMMMAVGLALGPIFILFILWEPTKGMFSAWLRKLVTIALIPVVTSAILVLMLSVINVTLPSMKVPAHQMEFYGIAPFLGLSLATTLILTQVFRICSSLAGGITLASISAGAAIVGSSLHYSGISAASRGAMNWSQNRARQLKRKVFRG
ncbi:MAG TPA: type IV secretion system protein [Candidatus Babeliales bacterium]|nr:type IV secretion system protein [Candidatus Babeliales bacterium]